MTDQPLAQSDYVCPQCGPAPEGADAHAEQHSMALPAQSVEDEAQVCGIKSGPLVCVLTLGHEGSCRTKRGVVEDEARRLARRADQIAVDYSEGRIEASVALPLLLHEVTRPALTRLSDIAFRDAEAQLAEAREIVASALTSLGTGPLRDGYAYHLLNEWMDTLHPQEAEGSFSEPEGSLQGSDAETPHERFVRENEDWNRKTEEAISDLENLAHPQGSDVVQGEEGTDGRAPRP